MITIFYYLNLYGNSFLKLVHIILVHSILGITKSVILTQGAVKKNAHLLVKESYRESKENAANRQRWLCLLPTKSGQVPRILLGHLFLTYAPVYLSFYLSIYSYYYYFGSLIFQNMAILRTCVNIFICIDNGACLI